MGLQRGKRMGEGTLWDNRGWGTEQAGLEPRGQGERSMWWAKGRAGEVERGHREGMDGNQGTG